MANAPHDIIIGIDIFRRRFSTELVQHRIEAEISKKVF